MVLVETVKEQLYILERLRLTIIQCQELKIMYYYILSTNPFRESCGIVLESGSGNLTDNLVLDGIKPFDDIVFFEYESAVDQSNIILNGTDSTGSNSGDNIITEDGFKLLSEEDTFINTIETERILLEDSRWYR